jgi:hypothetical protein
MKTPEDEAFEDIERRQGGGFPAKRAMAADRDALFEKFEVAQPAQEPVAWVDLTPAQVQSCVDDSFYHTAWSSEVDLGVLVKNITQALKEKNS